MADGVQAVQITGYGGPEVVRLGTIPRPVPGLGEVLIRARAFGVNPVDWKTREGMRRDRGDLPMPAILGCDVSGDVEETGPGVEGFAPGDAVFAMKGLHGAFSTLVAVPAASVARKPASLDHLHAAAVPLAALTALQALELAGLAPGGRVLIHAAAGGVGGFAVGIAKALGAAEVIGTASSANLDHVRSLGADRVIPYDSARFEEVSGMDVVLDLVGGETQDRSWQILKPSGFLVTALALPPENDPRRDGRCGARVGVRPNGAQLARIARWIEDGRLRVHLAATLPLTEAAKALERSRKGHIRGKIVLVPEG